MTDRRLRTDAHLINHAFNASIIGKFTEKVAAFRDSVKETFRTAFAQMDALPIRA